MPTDKSFIINSVLSPALMADALEITVSSSSKKNTFSFYLLVIPTLSLSLKHQNDHTITFKEEA